MNKLLILIALICTGSSLIGGTLIDGEPQEVQRIIAGTGVTVSPTSGVGDVTINASGATSNVFTLDGLNPMEAPAPMGSNPIVNVEFIDYEPLGADPAHQAGRVFYNAADDSWKRYYSSSEITMNDGEELWIPARNNTGTDITNGAVVYVTGQIGQQQTIALAIANDATKSKALAVATMDIANNSNGKCTVRGSVGDLDSTTTGGATGADIFLSATVEGAYTTNAPSGTNYCVGLGKLGVIHGVHGNINVNIQPAIIADQIFGFDEKVATNDNFVPVGGGTFTGRVYTTINYSTTAPAANEIPDADWVRSLSLGGAAWYLTQNAYTGTWTKATIVNLSTTVGVDLFTNTIAPPIPSDTYLAGGITTQLFGSLRSPLSYEIYINRVGGNASSVIPLHPEVYYVYEGTTNHLGDWSVDAQNIDTTDPTKYVYTIAFQEPVLTSSVYVVTYLKSETVSGSAAGLQVYGGNGRPSHFNISATDAGESFADALHIDGGNTPTADIGWGGYSITNLKSLVITNVVQTMGVYAGTTNFVRWTSATQTNTLILD